MVKPRVRVNADMLGTAARPLSELENTDWYISDKSVFVADAAELTPMIMIIGADVIIASTRFVHST